MPSEQAFDMVCLGGGVAAGESVRERRSVPLARSREGLFADFFKCGTAFEPTA